MQYLYVKFLAHVYFLDRQLQESKRLTQSQGVLPNGDAKVKTEH